jgi:hypothetical protein
MKTVLKEGRLPSGHGYRIERTNPEDDARELALRLGAELKAELTETKNARYYRAEAEKWRERIEDYERLLDKVRRRDAGEFVEYKSRMDPARTFSASALKEELSQMRKQVLKFECNAAGWSDSAKRHREQANRIQLELKG